MLSADEKEGMRQAAEGCSSNLTDTTKAATVKAAHKIKEALVKEFGDDAEAAARAAYMMCSTFAALRYTPVKNLDDLLSGSRDTYAFVAGALAGVYTLPAVEEVATTPDGEPVIVITPESVEDEAPSPGTGMYL